MPSQVNIRTLWRYLLGERDAILALIHSRRAIWIGLLFVFSAGFAREYDAESLWHEPWYLLIPLAASLGTSFLLYGLLVAAAVAKGAKGRGFLELYPTFLTLYWLTAPLAWLYAIPVERFLPPLEAAQANYALLAIVSVWRVLLITRAAAVMFSAGFGFTLSIVLWFADTLVVVAAGVMPKPIFDVMGGIELSQTESFIVGISYLAVFLGAVSWPFWLIAMLTSYANAKPTECLPERSARTHAVAGTTWGLAICSLVIWLAILPRTQPAQILRYRVERELQYGDIRRGLAMMSEHELNDFPPHWTPPPRIGYGKVVPDLNVIFKIISEEPVADWVAETYRRSAAEAFEDYQSRRRVSPPHPDTEPPPGSATPGTALLQSPLAN